MPGVRREERTNKRSTEDFQGSETTLYDTKMVDYHKLAKPINIQRQERILM